ncbi:helix-turn-helix domain-containing protein [Steroidobacter flavus]|uniref:Helix-turn-helix domain-containing protein n=1 Tax=Steroidobacter flavus TaxID=1842136 RepID=A0ABV8SVG3_9GAMM
MTRLVFRDFDEFAEAITGVDGRFIPTARSTSEWWSEAVRPGVVSLQQIQIGSPTTFAGDGEPGRFTLGLPMTDPTQIRIDGHFLEPDGFITLHEDQPFTFTGQDVVRWAGISVPQDTKLVSLELLNTARAGGGPRTRSALSYLDRLRWVAERAISANLDLSEPASVQAVEEEVAICLTHVLERSMKVHDRHVGRPQFSRSRVIARTLQLIEANEGQPLFIDDLCKATQVSERTLRNIFHEFFGVGPMRLLKVRQLREIRAALLRADPQRDTVTRIAARFGIWDFSLFARNYKALFGESPSRTLRTPPTEVKVRSSLSWLHYASKIFIDDMRPAAHPHVLDSNGDDAETPLVIQPVDSFPLRAKS